MKLGNLHIYRRPGWVGNFGLAIFTLTFIVLLSGCTMSWTQEADAILALLGPALTSLIGLLAAFGAKISPEVKTALNQAAAEARSDIDNVIRPLVQEYQDAVGTDQPSILVKIQDAVKATVDNFNGIFAALHIKDEAAKEKVQEIVAAIADELASVLAIIPAIQAAVVGGDHAFAAAIKGKTLPMSAGNFKKHFNHVVVSKTGDPEIDSVTPQYTLS